MLKFELREGPDMERMNILRLGRDQLRRGIPPTAKIRTPFPCCTQWGMAVGLLSLVFNKEELGQRLISSNFT